MEKQRSSSLLSRALRTTKDDVDICTVHQHGFLAVPLKSTNEVDLIKPLMNHFCSNENIDKLKFGEAIQRLNALRTEACCRTTRDHHALLDPITEYYDQLTALENHMERGVCIEGFKWKDAFGSDIPLLGKTTTGTLLLERLSVLFNYGALLSQIAASQAFLNDEEMRTSAKLFQQSAGIYVSLRSLVQQSPQMHSYTSDLLPLTLETLSNLMLAQAQESVYRKAFREKMNSTVLVKIASQTADFYQQASKEMTCAINKGCWKKEWLNMVSGKALGFQAIAQMHSAELHRDNGEHGERLARLRRAVELIESMKRYIAAECLHDQISRIQNAYKSAATDNKLIYHVRIPEFNTLPELPRAVLVKPLHTNQPLCSYFKDMFAFITPSKLARIGKKFDSMKREHLKRVMEKFLEQTEMMDAIVASLTTDVQSDIVRKKSREVRETGGVTKMQENIDELLHARKRALEILDKLDQMLSEEDKSDNDLRQRLGTKCERLPSIELVGPFKQEMRKLRGAIELASESDNLLANQFKANRKSIEMLCNNENVSRLFDPSQPSAAGEVTSVTKRDLNRFLRRAQHIKQESEEVLKEIESVCGSSNSQNLLENLTEYQDAEHDDVLKQKVEQICKPIENAIAAIIAKQKVLLDDIEKWSDRFSVEKNQNLRLLSLGYDAFVDIRAKTEDKSKFYKSIVKSLERLQRKVDDFSFARETEKEELLYANKNASGSLSNVQPPPAHLQ